MAIPLRQQIRVGAYVLNQWLRGRDRYPLVLMLEPLFRCNLACAGCGKIDYPAPILNRRLSVRGLHRRGRGMRRADRLDPGRRTLDSQGHRRDREGAGRARSGSSTCAPTRSWSRRRSTSSRRARTSPSRSTSTGCARSTTARSARTACSTARSRRSACCASAASASTSTPRCSTASAPDEVAAFLDHVTDELDVEGVTVSPGYAYERAPDQQHFLNRRKTKQLFRDIFRRGRGRRWRLNHSSLYLDFLAGNQDYRCTPWGNPTRNIFGWQRPCYLLGEGYARTFQELMETTDWDRYGTGNYEKCANCMAHCGYEATAVTDAVRHPLKALLGRAPADRDRTGDGARDPARAPAPGRLRVRDHRAGRGRRATGTRGPAARAQRRGVGSRARARCPGRDAADRPDPAAGAAALRAPLRRARPPSGPSACRAAAGISCELASASARTTRKGSPAREAASATRWLSMSTAQAAEVRCRAALAALLARSRSLPASAPSQACI